MQLWCHLPGVLREELPHRAAVGRVRAVAKLGIDIEQPQCSIGDPESRAAWRAVQESEAAILVVRATRNSLHVDLIEIVLTGLLIQESGLESMASLDLCDVIGNVIDRAGRVRGVG